MSSKSPKSLNAWRKKVKKALFNKIDMIRDDDIYIEDEIAYDIDAIKRYLDRTISHDTNNNLNLLKEVVYNKNWAPLKKGEKGKLSPELQKKRQEMLDLLVSKKITSSKETQASNLLHKQYEDELYELAKLDRDNNSEDVCDILAAESQEILERRDSDPNKKSKSTSKSKPRSKPRSKSRSKLDRI